MIDGPHHGGWWYHLLGGVGQGGPLKALRHLTAQPVGVLDALEEDGVLANALDAKGVVDGPHSCTRHAILIQLPTGCLGATFH